MNTTLTNNLIIPEVVSGLIDSNLGDGITLLPLFRGTGYDPQQYTQGDFSSNLYVIEAE